MSAPEDEPDVLGRIFSKLNCYSSNGKKQKIIVPRKENPDYDMNHARRGLAVIFNHEYFSPPLNERFKQRKGTEFDCECLTNTLKMLEFEVDVCPDLIFDKLDQKIENLSRMDFTDCDCLFIAVLTHGEPNNLLAAKDKMYVTSILFDRFTADNCPSLAGKPKIFVIQACQGGMVDPGVDVEADSGSNGGGDLIHQTYRIPIQADFLIAYSTVPGYVSWRQENTGSWFIQALCEELRNSWIDGSDLTVTLMNVNRRVAFNFQSNTPSKPKLHKMKQIPHYVSMLTRFVKFAPKAPRNFIPLTSNDNDNK